MATCDPMDLEKWKYFLFIFRILEAKVEITEPTGLKIGLIFHKIEHGRELHPKLFFNCSILFQFILG